MTRLSSARSPSRAAVRAPVALAGAVLAASTAIASPLTSIPGASGRSIYRGIAATTRPVDDAAAIDAEGDANGTESGFASRGLTPRTSDPSGPSVPEPGTAALFGMGVALFALGKKRRGV